MDTKRIDFHLPRAHNNSILSLHILSPERLLRCRLSPAVASALSEAQQSGPGRAAAGVGRGAEDERFRAALREPELLSQCMLSFCSNGVRGGASAGGRGCGAGGSRGAVGPRRARGAADLAAAAPHRSSFPAFPLSLRSLRRARRDVHGSALLRARAGGVRVRGWLRLPVGYPRAGSAARSRSPAHRRRFALSPALPHASDAQQPCAWTCCRTPASASRAARARSWSSSRSRTGRCAAAARPSVRPPLPRCSSPPAQVKPLETFELPHPGISDVKAPTHPPPPARLPLLACLSDRMAKPD
jgi:hypothetical protein